MRFFKTLEYQPHVDRLFKELSEKIHEALPGVEVEHIGSSAIRGAISKGDLDILVRVSPKDFALAIQALERIGFMVKAGTFRSDELCMLCGPQDSAVQLIVAGSEFEMFARFRDLLNANPEWVEQYNSLKESCAGWTQEDYRVRKSAFIERILKEPVQS